MPLHACLLPYINLNKERQILIWFLKWIDLTTPYTLHHIYNFCNLACHIISYQWVLAIFLIFYYVYWLPPFNLALLFSKTHLQNSQIHSNFKHSWLKGACVLIEVPPIQTIIKANWKLEIKSCIYNLDQIKMKR